MLKPNSCLGCPLASISNGFSEPEGTGSNGVAIIGEGLGHEEYIDGLPFRPHAQAGSKLEEAFKIVGRETARPCTRNQFRIWNLVGCQPPGNELAGKSYEDGAIAYCKQYFDPNVKGSRVILGLGNLTLKHLAGYSGNHDEKQSITDLRGYVLKTDYGWGVFSFHPSFIRRGNGHLTPILVQDIKRALAVSRGEFTQFLGHPSYKLPDYQVSPSIDEAWSFYYRVRDNPRLVLVYDIETADSRETDEEERSGISFEIRLVQFSLNMGEGIAFPWQGDYIKIIKMLFALPNIKAAHNGWNFDNPRLVAKGIRIEGKNFDTMWMFKHWNPSLPRGLQAVASLFNFPFPWKHLINTQLEWYGCADVDSCQWLIHKLPPLMKERGVWGGFIRHVMELHPILDRASQRGIPVVEEKRIALESKFQGMRDGLDHELQEAVPLELRNIKPTRKDKETGAIDYGYIREPKLVREGSERYTELCKLAEARGKTIKRGLEEWLYLKYNLTYARLGFTNTDNGNAGQEGSSTSGTSFVERWCKVEPFKASSTQMIRYLKWMQTTLTTKIEAIRQARDKLKSERKLTQDQSTRVSARINELKELAAGYEVPIHRKTKRPTTDKDHLEEIYEKTGDKVLEGVVRIRSLDTNLNNFLPNWKPDADGRVRTEWGYGAPTGQIDSRSPNVLNVSKHTEYGNEFRGIIVAPPGFVFREYDKKSFHVATLGYCANDAGYIRFSQLDPHSILGSYIAPDVIGQSISLKWGDKDILEACKEFKKRCKQAKAKDPQHGVDIRNEIAKPTVLGNQLELSARGLYLENRRYISSIKEAERLQSVIADLFDKVRVFKTYIKEKAFIDTYLIDEFQRIQYFHEVFKFNWNKNGRCWQRNDGPGARYPIAFRVQGTAFGMIQRELLEMERQGLLEEHNFLVSIHDSVVMMPEIGKADKCDEAVMRVMNTPCGLLVNEATGPQGLKVIVEPNGGKNWKAYDKETNPEGMQEIRL